jgi:pimeloyl-ACP methyl ester carboxylesterase
MPSNAPSTILEIRVGDSTAQVPIWEKGSGAPVVLLHGWGLDHTSLLALADRLAMVYRIVLVDLPGFGRAQRPRRLQGDVTEHISWGVPEYAQCVEQIIDRLVGQPATILGHSFGGRIGLWLASHAPENVHRLVLIASAGLRRPAPILQRIKNRILRTFGRSLMQWFPLCIAEPFRNAIVRRIASRDYLMAGALRQTLIKVVNENAGGYAAKITAPTLLLWGQDDLDTPTWMGKRLAELISHSRYVVLPDLDHLSILCEGRFQVAFQIQQFLAKSFPPLSNPQQVQP